MPIQNFNGTTFVAFTDISGFKEMMKNGNQAIRALDQLYQTAFDMLYDNDKINGFFVSDSGILFVRDTTISLEEQLKALLNIISEINLRLLQNDIMLTTSISYGQFKYNQRIEFQGIEKNQIYGNAYVEAFLDNETGRPKIQPGQCRIFLSEQLNNEIQHIRNIEKLIRKKNHFYYYWMVNDINQINDFERDYNDAYKQKYLGMLEALKHYRLTNRSTRNLPRGA